MHLQETWSRFVIPQFQTPNWMEFISCHQVCLDLSGHAVSSTNIYLFTLIILIISIESTIERITSSAYIPWDHFDFLGSQLQSCTGKSLITSTFDEMKCVYETIPSNHPVPRLTVIKEIRMKKSSNEVQCVVLNEEIGDPKVVTSSEELTDFAIQFFSSQFCYGLPSGFKFKNVKKISTGHRNSLNQWQSLNCSRKIEVAGWEFCLRCKKLRKALVMSDIRYFIIIISIVINL